jgi:hypothetical protein
MIELLKTRKNGKEKLLRTIKRYEKPQKRNIIHDEYLLWLEINKIRKVESQNYKRIGPDE